MKLSRRLALASPLAAFVPPAFGARAPKGKGKTHTSLTTPSGPRCYVTSMRDSPPTPMTASPLPVNDLPS